MKDEIRKCATILSNLRESVIRDREEELFAQEQRARRIASAERIRKYAQELGVKLYEGGSV